MAEHQSDLEKLQWLGGVLLLFGVSLYFSMKELRYLTRGETVHAQLVDVDQVEEAGRRGRTQTRLEFSYAWDDEGDRRQESDRTDTDFNPDTLAGENGNDAIRIEYLPGRSGESRLAGNRHLYWVWALLTSLLAAVGTSVKFFVDYYRFRASQSG